MATNTTVDLPNPHTPLSFLPPTIADQFQISIYVAISGLSIFVWDLLMSIPAEYKLLRTFNVSNAVYLISRIGTLAFCTTATIFQAANVAHCQSLVYIITACYVLAVPTTSLLFYFRIRAIWANSTVITVLFGMLWLANLGTSVLIVFTVRGDHIGPTQRCIETTVNSYASIVVIVNATYDTLIFILASVRIVSFTCAGNTWRAKLRSFVSGNGLPRLSKSLLQGGQLYYLATFGTSIFMTVMVMTPSIPPVYRAMLTIPNVALENILSCHVFRAIKLGFIEDNVSLYSRNVTVPRSRLRYEPEFTLENSMFDKSRTRQVNVEITTTTDIICSVQDEFYDKSKEDASDASDRV